MSMRLRDAKGRFCKAPKAPPLDPALVKGLRQGVRIVQSFEMKDYQRFCRKVAFSRVCESVSH